VSGRQKEIRLPASSPGCRGVPEKYNLGTCLQHEILKVLRSLESTHESAPYSQYPPAHETETLDQGGYVKNEQKGSFSDLWVLLVVQQVKLTLRIIENHAGKL